jgi:hypothetical protein
VLYEASSLPQLSLYDTGRFRAHERDGVSDPQAFGQLLAGREHIPISDHPQLRIPAGAMNPGEGL